MRSLRLYFYIVCLCVFFNGAVLQSVSGGSAAHMKDQGLSAEFVGIVTSIHALSLAVFKFLTGVIYDKKGLKVTLLLCQSAAVVMILLLSLVTSTVYGQFIAVLYAIIVGLALPLETVPPIILTVPALA